MRLFPTLAAALVATSMIAACNHNSGPSSDTPQSDQDMATQQPADIPSSSTTSDTNAAMNTTPPAASSSADSTKSTQTATASTTPAKKHVAKRHAKHHSGRSVAKSHRKHKNNPQASRARVRAHTERVAVLDMPQSDTATDRAEFKRDMQWRVAKIGDGVSRYHNQASITDSLTRYAQKIEDVKVADALARRQLRNIDTVSNDQWPSFKSNFQTQVSQLEQDYQSINQASR